MRAKFFNMVLEMGGTRCFVFVFTFGDECPFLLFGIGTVVDVDKGSWWPVFGVFPAEIAIEKMGIDNKDTTISHFREDTRTDSKFILFQKPPPYSSSQLMRHSHRKFSFNLETTSILLLAPHETLALLDASAQAI